MSRKAYLYEFEDCLDSIHGYYDKKPEIAVPTEDGKKFILVNARSIEYGDAPRNGISEFKLQESESRQVGDIYIKYADLFDAATTDEQRTALKQARKKELKAAREQHDRETKALDDARKAENGKEIELAPDIYNAIVKAVRAKDLYKEAQAAMLLAIKPLGIQVPENVRYRD